MGVSLMVMVAIIAPRQGLPRHPFAGSARLLAGVQGRAFWALMTPVHPARRHVQRLFTPTEAAAVATCYALFLGFVVYRTSTCKDLPAILIETAETTGIVMVLVMAAGALGWCMSISRIPQTLAPMMVAAIHDAARLPARVQPAAAVRRLLHGGAGGDADPDPDPGAGGDQLRHRSGPVRPDHDLQPDPRHDPSADRRRAVRHVAHRRRSVSRRCRARSCRGWSRCSSCWSRSRCGRR